MKFTIEIDTIEARLILLEKNSELLAERLIIFASALLAYGADYEDILTLQAKADLTTIVSKLQDSANDL